jgi:hypothetical protein
VRLRLVSDGRRNHALVTEQGDVVRGVRHVTLDFDARERPRATVTIIDLEVELRHTDDVPSLGRPSGDRP